MSFERLIRLVGNEGFAKLQKTHVAVVGIGGVGSWASESLARSGIGRLTLFDFDVVNPTNLNRQLTCLCDTVGRPKAQVMAERLRKINPAAQIEAINEVFCPENAELLWQVSPDIILDCIDNITYKCYLLAQALERSIPIVTSTGAGGRFDPTQIRVSDLNNTRVDPVALQVRKKLRRDYGFTADRSFHIPAVYSEELPQKPYLTEDESADTYSTSQTFITGKGRHAPPCGTSSFVTGAFGLVAASQVVKAILDR
ncbi:tRNA threonylcarbamoyladenosine dehydratase [bacterium]|nr:tRNA threonylcarbamoyladenosine dehydratase [bacterium]